jgi:hypothetical protein
MEGTDLEEFSHLMIYDDIPEGSEAGGYSPQELALREKELQLRQRELALREQELRLRQASGGGPRRGPLPPRAGPDGFDDDDEDDDYFDPSVPPPGMPMIDPDNFDMMSITSRKNRKTPSTNPAQFRKNPEQESERTRSRFRPSFGRNRGSQQLMNAIPTRDQDIMDDPLLGFTSNRYGTVDRGAMHAGSRANSLTAARLDELQYTQGPPPGGMNGGPPGPRRVSQSPGNPYGPPPGPGGMRGPNGSGPNGRPSPTNGYPPQPGMNGGRPSPPDGGMPMMKQPMPRYPPGTGNMVAPQQVEQHAGVSANLKHPYILSQDQRSLTGSASASARSGSNNDSSSAKTNLDSSSSAASVSVPGERSANSSLGSLVEREKWGVR